jgi:hypothetical protein
VFVKKVISLVISVICIFAFSFGCNSNNPVSPLPNEPVKINDHFKEVMGQGIPVNLGESFPYHMVLGSNNPNIFARSSDASLLAVRSDGKTISLFGKKPGNAFLIVSDDKGNLDSLQVPVVWKLDFWAIFSDPSREKTLCLQKNNETFPISVAQQGTLFDLYTWDKKEKKKLGSYSGRISPAGEIALWDNKKMLTGNITDNYQAAGANWKIFLK